MNVNGSRFALLLGQADWERCLDGDAADARTLAARWAEEAAPASGLPDWDAEGNQLTLRPLAIELPATPGEAALRLDARRGAAADRNGNVYRIGPDRRTLYVTSSGTRQETPFWPADPADCGETRAAARLDFQPVRPEDEPADERYSALAVTADDYLVVAFADGAARGFLTFDLLAGGPPVRTRWPGAVPLDALDMAARVGGGVWVLDRSSQDGRALLWELDRRLAVVGGPEPASTLAPAEPDDFQPLAGAPRVHAVVSFPPALDLTAWTADPIAVEVLGPGTVLVLDRGAPGSDARVLRLRRGCTGWLAAASHPLDELTAPAHDFVYGTAPLFGRAAPALALFITTARGNQARAFSIEDASDAFDLLALTELFPLRLYGGRALLAIQGAASYDSGIDTLTWTPIVHQPRSRFAPLAELVTPVFDSRDLGTTWDRVLLDACIPPDAAVEIFSRAGDDRFEAAASTSPADDLGQVAGAWQPEPRPQLRPGGPELPWLRAQAAGPTRPDVGVGTWEVLLQNARGRYLQLRIRLGSANGLTSPRIRALRLWWPRFSYVQRFLPGVYREDDTSASLLERWLANPESTLTRIEDAIATAQRLFDPRTVPAHALAWLAAWLDVALDPAWDERRQRLFVAYAMEFYRWRGTVHGLSLALQAAFDPCFDEAAFQQPDAGQDTPGGIRIVEAHQTRVLETLAADTSVAAPGLPQVASRGTRWDPGEGNAGLADRWAAAQGRGATPTEEITPFSLVPPGGATAGGGCVGDVVASGDAAAAGDVASWNAFMQSALGFVPAIGAAERALWQGYLARHHEAASELTGPDGQPYGSFGDIPLPPDFPADAEQAKDWADFAQGSDGAWMRGRWQDFLARRYRRIERLNSAWRTSWPSFDVVAIPDVLPETRAAQGDWLQFERQLVAMYRTAHRFSVLLPVGDVTGDEYERQAQLGLARRVVELEKPAHTVFDVRFFWAFFRIGEARLAIDTQLGAGSRAPELIPAVVLGRTYIGASFVGGPDRPSDPDRLLLAC